MRIFKNLWSLIELIRFYFTQRCSNEIKQNCSICGGKKKIRQERKINIWPLIWRKTASWLFYVTNKLSGNGIVVSVSAVRRCYATPRRKRVFNRLYVPKQQSSWRAKNFTIRNNYKIWSSNSELMLVFWNKKLRHYIEFTSYKELLDDSLCHSVYSH